MRAIYLLILTETAAYLVMSFYSPSVLDSLGFSTLALAEGQAWTLATSLFVHVTVIHLLLNTFSLFVFGTALEKNEGAMRTSSIFFAGGAGSLIIGIPLYSVNAIIVGSSVGVSAVAGATLLLRPDRLLPRYVFRAPVGLFAMIYLVFNVVLAFYDRSGLIAYLSHVIAFGLGVAMNALFKKFELRISNPLLAPKTLRITSGPGFP